ncbi:MAG: biopolymer transport protein ExbB [Planctomycetota bacterium]|jgi:biopolymer transport protein ExbB
MVDLLFSILRGITSVVGLEQNFINAWEAIRDFLELGGPVLYLVALVLAIMWLLIIERFVFFLTQQPKLSGAAVKAWEARSERKSWHAHRVREALISGVQTEANQYLGIIKACVALCPLVGLLGTVTGMITVFEVMSFLGAGNARAMAAGVSQATVPTMSGMVASLSGYFLSVWLQGRADAEVEALGEHMTMDH